jgi:hypothetical protein
MKQTPRHLVLAGAAVALAACGPGPPKGEIRQRTEDLRLSISSDPTPPYAREMVTYRVVVRDKETNAPIENGVGIIFATNRDGKSIGSGLLRSAELGTYIGKMNFVTSGEWAVAIEFQRDSTQRKQRMDWMQEVFAERDVIPPPTQGSK